MPKTLVKSADTQIIGGTFSNLENANKAVTAFRALGIPEQNIQVVFQLEDAPTNEAYSDMLTIRGVAEMQAVYYDKIICEGKTLVLIYDVFDPSAVIDVFNNLKAEYNPNGSRNLRDDVSGMTAGAAFGAVAVCAVGAIVAGPIGAVAGAATGALIGAGSGAAAGKAAEHSK